MSKQTTPSDFDDHIIQTFFDESTELINQLEEQLLSLEGNRDDMNAVNKVFRIMHTLKGNGAMFGFSDMSEFTHHLENIYDKIRNNVLALNDDIFSITLLALDHLRSLLFDPSSESTILMQNQLMQQFEDLSLGLKVNRLSKDEIVVETKEQRSVYYIHFAPHEDVLLDGTNPLFLVQDVFALDDCICHCYTGNIPSRESFNAEKCYLVWHLLLCTTKPKSDLEEVFMFAPDHSQPTIIDLGVLNLPFNETLISVFNGLANGALKIESFDALLQHVVLPEEKELNTDAKVKSSNSGANASLRVSVQKIDTLLNLVSELITVQAELSLLVMQSDDEALIEAVEQIDALSRGLRDNAFSISLMPIEQSLVRFQRLVRDVSDTLGKKVHFTVEGGETELDKTIIEHIIDPIMHILRNSIDHGIELPEKRVAAGKPEFGTIHFKAYCSGPFVVLEISDDGGGLNLKKIREIGIKRQIISESDILSESELMNLILAPGFSTADKVSEVSGRGVGMDVVHQKIREVRGELLINSQEGKGTTMTLRLPLTISIVDTLLVKAGTTSFLLPLSCVHQCDEINRLTIEQAKNKAIILNDNYLPFIVLSDEFEIPSQKNNDLLRIVTIAYGDIFVGLVVDEIVGQHQAVLKPLGLLYRRQEFISGASILGNGEVALVVDTNMLMKHHAASKKNATRQRVEMFSSY